MKLVFVHPHQPPDPEMHHLRCLDLAAAINKTGRHQALLISVKDFAALGPSADRACEQADLIIIQQDLAGSVLSAVQHWKALDKIIIADLQRTREELEPGAPFYEAWKESLLESQVINAGGTQEDLQTQLGWGLKLVDGATAATESIEKEWGSRADVRYLPTCLNPNQYGNVSRETRPGTVIGWIKNPGENSAVNYPAMQAVSQICRKQPTVRLLCIGIDQEAFETIPIPRAQKELRSSVPAEQWASMLTRFDLAIIPEARLSGSHFTELRCLEYMIMQIPWIAAGDQLSPGLAKHGRVLDDGVEDWFFKLSNLAMQPTRARTQTCRGAYLAGLSRNIDDHIGTQIDILRAFGVKAMARKLQGSFS